MSRVLSIILSLVLLILLACSNKDRHVLTIAAASNMRPAMDAIIPAFEKESGIDSEVIFSSSGKLTAQILEGAPFDMFLSADIKYPESIYQAGLSRIPPVIYAKGKLILWSLEPEDITLELLLSPEIDHIAVSNSITAPYGRAAREFLESCDLYSKVEHKLVFGESIAQANQFLLSQAADLCLTSLSTIRSPSLRGQGSWMLVDTNSYNPIYQALVILKKRRRQVKRAEKFRDFLFSQKGQNMLRDFGYDIPE